MKVADLIKEINEQRSPNDKKTYDTKSQKDELLIMKAMLNDKEYKVDVYKGNYEKYNEFSYCKYYRYF